MAERRVVIGAGSFSVNSGGRTKSSFARAEVLAEKGWRVMVATYNHKIDYGRIYDSWHRRYGESPGIVHANFFEWCAGEQLYTAVPAGRVFDLPEGAKRAKARVWSVADSTGSQTRYVLGQEGLLSRVEQDLPSGSAVHTAFASGGTVRSVSVIDGCDGSRQTEMHAPSGAVFCTVERTSDGVETLVWPSGSREPINDARGRWIRDVVGDGRLIVDDRVFDQLILEDRDRDSEFRAISVIHSNHLLPPYADIHEVASYNGDSLRRGPQVGLFVYLTKRQFEDVHAAGLGTSEDVIIPHFRRPGAVRVPLRRRSQDFVMLTRLVEIKRIDHAIRAFHHVVSQFPQARLRIYGDGPLRDKLRWLIASLGLERNVLLMGHTSDPETTLNDACALIVTSMSEGYALSLLEALTAGLPAIAYDFRYGPRDMIVDNLNGLLVEDGDVDALGTALSRLLGSRTLRARLSLGARVCQVGISREKFGRLWEKALGADV